MDCLWHAPEWCQYGHVADVIFLWKLSFTIKHLADFEKNNCVSKLIVIREALKNSTSVTSEIILSGTTDK